MTNARVVVFAYKQRNVEHFGKLDGKFHYELFIFSKINAKKIISDGSWNLVKSLQKKEYYRHFCCE